MQNNNLNGNSNDPNEQVSVVSAKMKVILALTLIVGLVTINQILYRGNSGSNGDNSPNDPNVTPTASQPSAQEVWQKNRNLEQIMTKMGKDIHTKIETEVPLINNSEILIPDQVWDPAKHIDQYDYMVIKDGKEIPKRITWKNKVINYGTIDPSDPIGIGIIFAHKYVNLDPKTDRKVLFKDLDNHISDPIKEVIMNPNIPLTNTINIGAVRIQRAVSKDTVIVRVVILNISNGNDDDAYSYFDVQVKYEDDAWKVADFTIHRGDDVSGIHGGY